MQNEQIIFPKWLMNIPYNGRIVPNGQTRDIATTGANCQVFAYHLLRLNNLVVPDFRSSELWEDTEFSEKVEGEYQPFDLLFFHHKKDSYGAHIAVFLGDNRAVHSSRKIGFPVIWEMETFFEHTAAYSVLLGGKRFFKEEQL